MEVHFAWSCYWRSEADGSQGSLHYGNAVMIRREPYGGSIHQSNSTKIAVVFTTAIFVELMEGVEPSTSALRMLCSAIKLHQRIALCKYNRAAMIIQTFFAYSSFSSLGTSSVTVSTSFTTRSATFRNAIATVSPVDAPAAFSISFFVFIAITYLLFQYPGSVPVITLSKGCYLRTPDLKLCLFRAPLRPVRPCRRGWPCNARRIRSEEGSRGAQARRTDSSVSSA